MLRLPSQAAGQDAGRGLWLRGTGRRQARGGSGPEIRHSGLWRNSGGAALCDFGRGTGGWILAISQTERRRSYTRMCWANRACACRLAGPPGKSGREWGATMRLVFGGRYGAARGDFMAVRATGRREAWCRSWGCPEGLRLKFGCGGRVAKPPPAPFRLERRKSTRGHGRQADDEPV